MESDISFSMCGITSGGRATLHGISYITLNVWLGYSTWTMLLHHSMCGIKSGVKATLHDIVYITYSLSPVQRKIAAMMYLCTPQLMTMQA